MAGETKSDALQQSAESPAASGGGWGRLYTCVLLLHLCVLLFLWWLTTTFNVAVGQ